MCIQWQYKAVTNRRLRPQCRHLGSYLCYNWRFTQHWVKEPVCESHKFRNQCLSSYQKTLAMSCKLSKSRHRRINKGVQRSHHELLQTGQVTSARSSVSSLAPDWLNGWKPTDCFSISYNATTSNLQITANQSHRGRWHWHNSCWAADIMPLPWGEGILE